MMHARATRQLPSLYTWSALCAAALASGCAGGGWIERSITAELPFEGPQNSYPTALRAAADAKPTAFDGLQAQAAPDLPGRSPSTAASESPPQPAALEPTSHTAPASHTATASRLDRQQANLPVLAVVPPQYVTHPFPAQPVPPTPAPTPAVPTHPQTAPTNVPQPAALALDSGLAASPSLTSDLASSFPAARAGHFTISDAPATDDAASLSAAFPAAASTPVGQQAPPTSDAPAELRAQGPVDVDQAQRELIEALEAEIRRRREAGTADEELPRLEQQLRLAYVAAGRLDDAVAAVESLDAQQREAYRNLMFGLGVWLSPDEARRAPLRTAKVLHSLRDATSDLAASSKLELRNLVFCERVDYFGWYTEFPRKEFQPKQQVLLYVEVQNFAAEHKGAAGYETELNGSYEILDASGQIVASRQLPPDKEICRNYRRDYFLAYRIYMPDSIAPGHYRLELTLEDLKARGKYQGRKLGEGMIEFTIR